MKNNPTSTLVLIILILGILSIMNYSWGYKTPEERIQKFVNILKDKGVQVKYIGDFTDYEKRISNNASLAFNVVNGKITLIDNVPIKWFVINTYESPYSDWDIYLYGDNLYKCKVVDFDEYIKILKRGGTFGYKVEDSIRKLKY